jgi:DNA-binding response OmpR family regulator
MLDRRAFTAVLSADGYTVEPVTTARAARQKLEEGSFHVAIIDCQIPGDDGFSIAAKAREKNAAVVLISGEDRAMTELPQSGFCFLEKPFTMARLLRAVREAMNGDGAAP